MSNMVNTFHDAGAYGQSCSQHDVYNAENLYKAYRKAIKASWWKDKDIQSSMTYLPRLAALQQSLLNRSFRFSPSSVFLLNERGKTRLIRSDSVADRIIGHVLCDEVVIPALMPHLAYDNGACVKGKGIAFTRRRLVTHLSRFYRKYGNNGYILLIDFAKYYDNIDHKILLDMMKKYIKDETSIWLIEEFLSSSKLDISFMTEEEAREAEEGIFNSTDYFKNLDEKKLTGERYLSKHLFMGAQFPQIAGVLLPTPLDSFIKTVKGEKFYARYMDDSYILSPNKEHLEKLLVEIVAEAKKIGITINLKKTKIIPLSSYFTFLQVRYHLTETGRIERKTKSDRVTRERRKLKKLAKKMNQEEFTNTFNTWYESSKKLLSYQTKKSMKKLFNELLETIPETAKEEPKALYEYLMI